MDNDSDGARAGTAPSDGSTTPSTRQAASPDTREDTSTSGRSEGAGSGAGTSGSGSGRRRRRRGGRGRGGRGGGGSGGGSTPRGSSADAQAASEDHPSGADAPTDAKAEAPKQGPKQPKQGGQSRPRQSRPKAALPKESAKAALPEPAKDADGRTDAGTPVRGDTTPEGSGEARTSSKPRSRGRRGGRGRGGRPRPQTPAIDQAQDDVAQGQVTAATQRDDAMPEQVVTSRQPRSGKGRGQGQGGREKAASGAAAKIAAASQPDATLEERVAAGGPTRGIRSTRSRTGRDGRRRREPAAPPPRATDKVMVITEHGERDQIAVLEENVLVQHYVTRIGATSMVGNVYLGRVQNVLPGMEAAFVDVGRGRNGVLYAGEVNYDPADVDGPAPRIEQLLKPGQAVMVQVTKDPMGGKGARLTANLSLAGRYLVLAPNQDLQGISRRLGDDARKRLKAMLKRVKPAEHGVIVRTAAEGVSEAVLEADLRRLLSIWDRIGSNAKKTKAPSVLYEEPELTVRVVRDLFTDEEFKALVTDSPRVHGKVMEYLGEVAPDLAEKVHLHADALPAFEEHRVVEQIHKALDKKVWLPSGGYLFIERTEAMTIVDVNTGKSVGKTNLEETVVNTNLEAAREVARQLRLRDIGGIIVIDFIDMLLEKNKRQVEDTMREELARDKTRSQVFEIGPLGLMQVTRKRVSSGLVESFSETCPTCEGRGFLLTYDVD